MSEASCYIPPRSPTGGKYMIYLVRVMLSEAPTWYTSIQDRSQCSSKSYYERPCISDFPIAPPCDWRNQKSSNLWTLWPGAGCYVWFDLGKDHRSVHPRLTAFADASLYASVLKMMNLKLFSGRENERRQILHRFVKTDLWTFRKTLRWKKIKLKAINIWDVSLSTAHNNTGRRVMCGKFGRKWFLNRLHLVRTTDEVRN